MSGTTPRVGLPYQEGFDLVSAGDDTIKAQAEKLDSPTALMLPKRIAAGTGSLPSSASATSQVSISFPAGRFTANPSVVLLTMAMNTSIYTMLGYGSLTATGFQAIGGVNSASGAVGSALSFYWLAVQI